MRRRLRIRGRRRPLVGGELRLGFREAILVLQANRAVGPCPLRRQRTWFPSRTPFLRLVARSGCGGSIELKSDRSPLERRPTRSRTRVGRWFRSRTAGAQSREFGAER